MQDSRTTLLKVNSTLEDVKTMVSRLTDSIDNINLNLLSEKNVTHLSNTMANLEHITATISQSSKNLEPTFQEMQATIATIKQAAEAAEDTFSQATAQLKYIEPALKEVPATLTSLKQASQKATHLMGQAEGVIHESHQTIAKLNNSNGLFHTLTSDQEVNGDIKIFLKNLRQYGILRYRDEETKESPHDRFKGPRR